MTVFRSRALSLFQYRWASLAKLAPPLFVGLVQTMFFTAFFASSQAEQPLRLDQAITYIWLVQLLIAVQPWGGDPEVMQIIRTGNLAYELCRPLDLYGHWFSRLVAQRLVPLALQSAPLALVVWLAMPPALRPGPPASPGALLAFAAAVVVAVLMSSALSCLLGIFTVWTVSGEGIYYLAPVLFQVLSGAIVPLPLFPPWLQPLLRFLPFRALLDTPAQVYLGLIAPSAAVPLLAQLLLWTAAFVLLGRWLLAKALKSVTIAGG